MFSGKVTDEKSHIVRHEYKQFYAYPVLNFDKF